MATHLGGLNEHGRMILLHRLTSIVRRLVRRRRDEQELHDELQAFVEMAAADKRREGESPAEARRLAMLELGGVEPTKERIRSARHGAWLEEIGRDVRYAGRTCVRNPGFSAIAVITLALGIGANTAVFSLLDAVMLRTLPVDDPERLLQLIKTEGTARRGENYSYPQAIALAEQTDVVAGLFGVGASNVLIGVPGSLERVHAAWVTGAYYETLGLRPVTGRLLLPSDDRPGAAPAAVITDDYWRRRFARDPAVIGGTILIEGTPVPVVGVSPRGFGGVDVGDVADVTLTATARPQLLPREGFFLKPGATWLRVFLRLQPAVTREQAAGRLAGVWSQLSAPRAQGAALASPVVSRLTLTLVDGQTGSTPLREQFSRPLYVLMAIVGLVLMIACANVATLLLARSTARQRELAVRLALGAGAKRIARQLLVESLVLSMAGAVVGVGIAWWGSRALVELLSSGQLDPLALDVKPNANVLLFTSVAALVTALCFGIAPAFTASTSSPAFVLSEGSFRIVGPRGRLASMLVIFQVGVSVLLLVGAGLFLRSLHNLRTLDPGFRHEGVWIVHADGARAGRSGAELVRLYDELLQEASRIPGVRSASFSMVTPPSGGGGISLSVRVNDQPTGDAEFHVNGVSPRYFETMTTPVLAGREFTSRDDGAAPKVAIVNQTFAERHLGGASPLGQRLSFTGPASSPMEIVGVVHDAVYETLRAGAPPTVYVPVAQLTGDIPGDVTFEIGTDGRVAQMALQQAFQRRLPRTLPEVRTLTSQVERTLVRDRLMATLAASFGGLGLTLAAIGLYGLLAYLVARRTNEIGVRMALGATHANVIWTVMRDALTMLALGAACGLPVAWSASRLVASMLFGMEPFDALINLGAVATLIAAGALAAFVPAYSAASVDPMIALRHE